MAQQATPETSTATPSAEEIQKAQEQRAGVFKPATSVQGENSSASDQNKDEKKEEKKKVTFLSGYQKAAVLLVALGVETGAKMIKELRRDEVEQITRFIATMDRITAEQVEAVLDEYDDLLQAKKFQLTGGYNTAKEMLISAKGQAEADEFLRRHELGLVEDNFTLIRKKKAVKLAEYIRSEQPQIGALIVANLDHEQAADVLSHLSSDLSVDIAMRISNLGNVSADVMDEITSDLLETIGTESTSFMNIEKGPGAVANILNAADTVTETKVLDGIENLNAELAEAIRSQMFFFDDFLYLEDLTLQVIINACSKSDLTMSLKGVSDKLRDKFTDNMSARAKDILLEDMENLGPLTRNQVRDAQQAILKTMKQLQADGKIIVVKDSEKLID